MSIVVLFENASHTVVGLLTLATLYDHYSLLCQDDFPLKFAGAMFKSHFWQFCGALNFANFGNFVLDFQKWQF